MNNTALIIRAGAFDHLTEQSARRMLLEIRFTLEDLEKQIAAARITAYYLDPEAYMNVAEEKKARKHENAIQTLRRLEQQRQQLTLRYIEAWRVWHTRKSENTSLTTDNR